MRLAVLVCLGRRLSGLDELRDTGLDRLVSGELGLGVKLKVPFGPVECVDHGVIARGAVTALGVKKMTEQKVQRSRLSIPIADRKGTCGSLTLSRLQK
jgi:hypothetical protein